jgi:uncharacterized protein (DUF433 family)
MTEAEIAQILERLEKLEAQVRELEGIVRAWANPPDASAVREPSEPYATGKDIISTDHPHIVRIPSVQNGTPLVRGAYNTVWGIVELFQQGRTPKQIVKEKGKPLALAQVHDALSYYYDHQEEIDHTLTEQKAALEEFMRLGNEMRFGHKAAPRPEPAEAVTPAPKETLPTDHPHIIRIPGVQGGEPIVRDAYKTVRGIIELTRQGLSPEQIADDHGPPLTVAGVHDALSYYYDHQEEMEAILAGHQVAMEDIIRISREQQAEYARRKRGADVR